MVKARPEREVQGILAVGNSVEAYFHRRILFSQLEGKDEKQS